MKATAAVKKVVGIAVLMVASSSWGATINSGTTDVSSLDASSGISQLPNAGQQAEGGEFAGRTSLPEPGSLSLLAAGLLGLVAARRLVNKKA